MKKKKKINKNVRIEKFIYKTFVITSLFLVEQCLVKSIWKFKNLVV